MSGTINNNVTQNTGDNQELIEKIGGIKDDNINNKPQTHEYVKPEQKIQLSDEQVLFAKKVAMFYGEIPEKNSSKKVDYPVVISNKVTFF